MIIEKARKTKTTHSSIKEGLSYKLAPRQR